VISSIVALTFVIHFANLAGAPDAVVREAQAGVADILHDIDVQVQWVAASDPVASRQRALHVTLLRYEAGALKQTNHQVLGAATRTELGTGIALVFFQRVVEEADAYAVPVSRVLAGAIAHEIGHLLQTETAHEPSGLMRAVWTRADFRQLSTGRLRFTPSAGIERTGR
jgi:hypothetical protein